MLPNSILHHLPDNIIGTEQAWRIKNPENGKTVYCTQNLQLPGLSWSGNSGEVTLSPIVWEYLEFRKHTKVGQQI